MLAPQSLNPHPSKLRLRRGVSRQGQYTGEVPAEVKGVGALEYGQWEELEEVVRTSAGTDRETERQRERQTHIHRGVWAVGGA
eukprot:738379-Rhodomonas_salina.1